MQTYLDEKVTVRDLPCEGGDAEERKIISAKGEMAQILNRSNESFRHLVYWDLDSGRSGQARGNHYHLRKTERYYIIHGRLDMLLYDMETLQKAKIMIYAGQFVTVAPRVAHAFVSSEYSQVLEISPEPYDASDTVPCNVVGSFKNT